MASQAVLAQKPAAQQPVRLPTINVPFNFNLQAVDARLQQVPPEKSSVEQEVSRLDSRPFGPTFGHPPFERPTFGQPPFGQPPFEHPTPGHPPFGPPHGPPNNNNAPPLPPNNDVPPTPPTPAPPAPPTPAPPAPASNLPEPLNFFNGTFRGPGFNMIFRPNSNKPLDTTFPNTPGGPGDNVMEINLTIDQIQFSDTLGPIPNRGLGSQDDINLSGVSYIQNVLDVTNPVTGKGDAPGKAIHFEPGIWTVTPALENPSNGANLARMASIPHGTTILAQGTCPVGTVTTAATIDSVSIKPTAGGTVFDANTFPNMNVSNASTRRLPQDLTPFINAGTITQDILNDPNTVLRNANKGKTILSSTQFTVDTDTTSVSGNKNFGTASIDMLQPNALPVKVTSTFYIQKVQYQLTIPAGTKAGTTLTPTNLPADPTTMPSFVTVGTGVASGRSLNCNVVQIQYSQIVQLSFVGLSWPHISVATLSRADIIGIPLDGPADLDA